MEQRRYTVDEIDHLREAVHTIQGVTFFDPLARTAATEHQLRTYLAAGVDPDALDLKAEQAAVTLRDMWKARLREWADEREYNAAHPLPQFSEPARRPWWKLTA